MVNSRCAHGLQEPFSPQPKAMSRLARNNRRRLDTSILIILLVTSAVPPIGLVSTLDAPAGQQKPGLKLLQSG